MFGPAPPGRSKPPVRGGAAFVPTFGEHPGTGVCEFDRSPNGLREELLVDPFGPTEATLGIPQGPDLCVEFDPDAAKIYRTNR